MHADKRESFLQVNTNIVYTPFLLEGLRGGLDNILIFQRGVAGKEGVTFFRGNMIKNSVAFKIVKILNFKIPAVTISYHSTNRGWSRKIIWTSVIIQSKSYRPSPLVGSVYKQLVSKVSYNISVFITQSFEDEGIILYCFCILHIK